MGFSAVPHEPEVPVAPPCESGLSEHEAPNPLIYSCLESAVASNTKLHAMHRLCHLLYIRTHRPNTVFAMLGNDAHNC